MRKRNEILEKFPVFVFSFPVYFFWSESAGMRRKFIFHSETLLMESPPLPETNNLFTDTVSIWVSHHNLTLENHVFE